MAALTLVTGTLRPGWARLPVFRCTRCHRLALLSGDLAVRGCPACGGPVAAAGEVLADTTTLED